VSRLEIQDAHFDVQRGVWHVSLGKDREDACWFKGKTLAEACQNAVKVETDTRRKIRINLAILRFMRTVKRVGDK
jgi:hypothetical protein